MTVTLFGTIRLPYLGWKSRVAGKAALRGASIGTPNLPRHLLRDIGLLDGHETPRGRAEPSATARDMVERYR
ncbi:hypothetical protein GCM10007874_56720 [Labrys miyagiensis]|uniref:DUF1127 domain-containing protein n=1 Tax=Labrys miyagiensis TaxID=346912 RepID=A0ABQ6CQN4_9HYPH|nr:hypothetical protein [Labrys miyagiensis]GLS22652.1 hypothetical protein GCM10007874_56720 [Labrys miyagiensis]